MDRTTLTAVESGGSADTEPLIHEAVDGIAERIVSSALWTGSACQWVITIADPDFPGDARPVQTLTEGCLYHGTAGVALFLSEHAARTGSRESNRTAVGALKYAYDEIHAMPGRRIGFYAGALGVAYAHLRHADASGDDDFRSRAVEMLAQIEGGGAPDASLDVIGGGAGAIPALLWFADRLRDERWVDLAVKIGDTLIRRATHECDGWSWGHERISHERNLLGLAHGAAGFGWAFLELYAATGHGRFRFASEQAFSYETRYYDSAQRNWPDFRNMPLARLELTVSADKLRELARSGQLGDTERTTPAMVAWCHGAPGIGLARLRAYEISQADEHRRYAKEACQTTVASLANSDLSHSLCHGSCGNAETLQRAARTLCAPDLERLVRQYAVRWAREAADGGGWRSGALGGATDPTLMVGEAGIGYFYLRLLYPSIESVLLPGGDRALSTTAHRADESYRQACDANVRRYFGRTLAILEAHGQSVDETIGAMSGPTGTLHDVLRRIDEMVDAAGMGHPHHPLVDAWRPERLAFELRAGGRTPGQRALDDLERAGGFAIDWGENAARLAAATQIAPAIWDWDTWLSDTDKRAGPPQLPLGHAYVVTDHRDARGWRRVGPFVAAVLRALVTPRTANEIAVHLRDCIDREVADQRIVELVKDVLHEAHQGGIIDVTSAARAQPVRSSVVVGSA